ncbi:PDZ domain-containing protein [Saccharopolyspora spinosporotrichia]
MPGGAAEAAGIRPGEVITKLGDRAIQDPDELIAAVRSRAPGEQVQLTTTDRAGGGERTVTVTLVGEKG